MSAFRAAMAGERMHHAWLLAGPRGIGKALFADWASRRLLDAEDPSSQGAHLLAAGSHPDFRRLERLTNEKTGNLARNISIDQVRGLRAMFATATSLGARRVILVDSIDDMERGAANALLKNLEEPPASTVFLLVSHAPGRLLPTIRSRCRTLMFRPLSDADMRRVLDDFDPDRRDALIASAHGSPASALASAALDLTAIDSDLAELASTGDPANAIRGKLAQSLSGKAALPRYEAFLARTPAFIAHRARHAEGDALATALTAWERARALSQIAIPQSLVVETVVFEMAGMVASLAPAKDRAKA
jgi:DNA polymerase III subunit delta'